MPQTPAMAPAKSKEPEQPPARRNRTEAIARGTDPLIADIFARAGFHDPTLVVRWSEIAGPEVARMCQPTRLSEGPSGGVLTLKAEPGAAVFLQHQTRNLRERINGFLGRQAVDRLRFVQGPLLLPAQPRRPSPPPGPLCPSDPVVCFAGPGPVREALLKLARRRTARRPTD